MSKQLRPIKMIEISDVSKSHPIFKISNPHKLRDRANELGFVEPI